MRYRSLGKSGLQVSVIGFGCMSLGNDYAENESLIHQALAAGINFFDTADLYQKGENEITVGRALKGKRNEVYLATKVGNEWKPDGSGWNWNPKKSYILAAVEKSLERLQTDYIDLYQLHGGTIDDPIDDTIEAFEILKQQGKIRQYGISSIRPEVIRAYVSRSGITSVMMQYSLLDRRPEESCLSLLERNNIGVLARGTLAKGLLVNKPAADYLNYSASDVQNLRDSIFSLSHDEFQGTQIALQFVLHHTAISSAVVGIRERKHLEQALASLTAPNFNEIELEYMTKVLPPNRYEQYR